MYFLKIENIYTHIKASKNIFAKTQSDPTYIVTLWPSWISMAYLIFFSAAGHTTNEQTEKSRPGYQGVP